MVGIQRVFPMTNAGEDEYWVGSADLMGRNLNRRVESLVRIERPTHKASLQEIFDLSLSEETASWHQDQGSWKSASKNSKGEPLQDLQGLYIKRYKKVH